MNNIGKEEHCLLRLDSRDWPSLNPLRELVDGDKQVGEALGHFLERPDKVQTSDCERPSDGDRLEHFGWLMSLLSIVLASFARAYYLGRVSHDKGLVDALLECISDMGAWRYVVIVDVPMDVL
jgi:hypothetical protein